jgi:hypothetical protein
MKKTINKSTRRDVLKVGAITLGAALMPGVTMATTPRQVSNARNEPAGLRADTWPR